MVPGFGWHQGIGKLFRLSLGLKLFQVPEMPVDMAFVPLPDIQFWFKF